MSAVKEKKFSEGNKSESLEIPKEVIKVTAIKLYFFLILSNKKSL